MGKIQSAYVGMAKPTVWNLAFERNRTTAPSCACMNSHSLVCCGLIIAGCLTPCRFSAGQDGAVL